MSTKKKRLKREEIRKAVRKFASIVRTIPYPYMTDEISLKNYTDKALPMYIKFKRHGWKLTIVDTETDKDVLSIDMHTSVDTLMTMSYEVQKGFCLLCSVLLPHEQVVDRIMDNFIPYAKRIKSKIKILSGIHTKRYREFDFKNFMIDPQISNYPILIYENHSCKTIGFKFIRRPNNDWTFDDYAYIKQFHIDRLKLYEECGCLML